MTDEAMSPLRRRMIEDMSIRKLSPKTQQGYIRTIKNLAAFLGRSPDTLPAAIADIAYQNKAVIYNLLFKASAETLITIAADPKHLGARVGVLSVLHTWGSALTHHPHVHMIVPGGGISLDGTRWVPCRAGFFLPVRVLSRLFRRLFLDKLVAAHEAGRLTFFGHHAPLTDAQAFAAYLAPLRNVEWVVYSKRPFGGPEEVLRYLARYTHRVAISNSRLIALDDTGVTFKWKDYRIEGRDRYKQMTLGDPRVHPPLPDPRAARRLPPHPPLWPVRQHFPRQQRRASTRAARRAEAPEQGGRCRLYRDRRTPHALASVPLLRRPHDHHRDLQPRQLARISPAVDARHQDRHIMTTTPEPQRPKAARLLRWFSTGHAVARQNTASALPLSRRFSPIDPAVPLESGPILPLNLRSRRKQSCCPHSASPSASLKSP
jgi:hypothetical protein